LSLHVIAPNSKHKKLFQQQNLWLTQNSMAKLFDVQKAAISKHLSNIYLSGELSKETTVSILETVQTEGNRQIKRNLDYAEDRAKWI